MTKAEQLMALGIPMGAAVELGKAHERVQDVPKIGVADATDAASAVKLANACKARLNELIEALKG